jgi:hypothetical protein
MNNLKYVKMCFLSPPPPNSYSFELRLFIPVRFSQMQEYLKSSQPWLSC